MTAAQILSLFAAVDLSRDAAQGVYVLHCFEKKTQQTSRSELELAKKRVKAIAR